MAVDGEDVVESGEDGDEEEGAVMGGGRRSGKVLEEGIKVLAGIVGLTGKVDEKVPGWDEL